MEKEKTDYELLKEYQKKYPELTYQNKPYNYLPKKIQEKYKKQIKEIEEILARNVDGFVEFNNFKVHLKTDKIVVRLQYDYSYKLKHIPYFVGVGYYELEEFKKQNNEKRVI